VKVLRAHLEALEGRCVLRANVEDGGASVRFGTCPAGPATLRAQLEGVGWQSYPVEIPAQGASRFVLD